MRLHITTFIRMDATIASPQSDIINDDSSDIPEIDLNELDEILTGGSLDITSSTSATPS